jgi:hypothetical protein
MSGTEISLVVHNALSSADPTAEVVPVADAEADDRPHARIQELETLVDPTTPYLIKLRDKL